MAKFVDAPLPPEVFSATALNLMPLSLEYELISGTESLERKQGRGLERIERDVDRIPGIVGGDVDLLMPLMPRTD